MDEKKILARCIAQIDAITDRVDCIKKEAIAKINNIRDEAIGFSNKEHKKESILASSLSWPLWAKSAVEIKAIAVTGDQTEEIAQVVYFFKSEEPDLKIAGPILASLRFKFPFYTETEFWKFETKPTMIDPPKIIFDN